MTFPNTTGAIKEHHSPKRWTLSMYFLQDGFKEWPLHSFVFVTPGQLTESLFVAIFWLSTSYFLVEFLQVDNWFYHWHFYVEILIIWGKKLTFFVHVLEKEEDRSWKTCDFSSRDQIPSCLDERMFSRSFNIGSLKNNFGYWVSKYLLSLFNVTGGLVWGLWCTYSSDITHWHNNKSMSFWVRGRSEGRINNLLWQKIEG